jgi:hypothetical protein
MAKFHDLKYLEALKIFPMLREIILSIGSNKVTKVVAKTGSGKTIGIPHSYITRGDVSGIRKRLWVSVPTIINVVYQYNYALEKLPSHASYIGFIAGGRASENANDATLLYATTQSVVNRLLNMYKSSPSELNNLILMIDEAHHPSMENYILHGLANWFISKGFDIRILITSATPSDHKFDHLADANVFECDGVQFPIDITWHPETYHRVGAKGEIILDNKDRLIVDTIRKIESVLIERGGEGDVLVFVSGESDAETIRAAIESVHPELAVYVAYSALPQDELLAINEPSALRKVIIATNVAESGITINGVVSVIDTLLYKRKIILGNLQSMVESFVSQSSSLQRRGRAGRTRKGYYYPMCNEAVFASLPKYIESEFANVPKHLPIIGLLKSKLPACEVLAMSTSEYVPIIEELTILKMIDVYQNVLPLGIEVTKYPFSLKMAVSLVNAISKLDITKADIVERTEKFYMATYVILALSLLEARMSSPNVFYIPKESRFDQQDYIREIAETHGFSGIDDLDVLINMYCMMMTEVEVGRGGHINYYKWCRSKSINLKFIELVNRFYNQVFLAIIGNAKLGPAEYDYIQSFVTESHSRRLIRDALFCGYSTSTFKLAPGYGKVQYTRDTSTERYGIDNKSVSSLGHMKPADILALTEILIKPKKGGAPFVILNLCIALS